MKTPETRWLLGLDLGGTRLKAKCITVDGDTLDEAIAPSRGDGWTGMVRDCVHGLVEKHGSPESIGFAAPGLPSVDETRIAHMPGKLPGLEGLNWGEFLGLEKPVPVMNDAHAALMGEVWLGAARNLRNVVLLTLGTGVGGGVLLDGRLLRGRLGRAGHLGHMSIHADRPLDFLKTPGSLEYAIGNYTVGERSDGRFSSTKDLLDAAKSGDDHAMRVWRESIRGLAAGVTSLINAFDPEAIVIAGGISEAGDDLFLPLAEEMERVEWRPDGSATPILRATLGEWAGAFGAAWYSYHGGSAAI